MRKEGQRNPGHVWERWWGEYFVPLTRNERWSPSNWPCLLDKPFRNNLCIFLKLIYYTDSIYKVYKNKLQNCSCNQFHYIGTYKQVEKNSMTKNRGGNDGSEEWIGKTPRLICALCVWKVRGELTFWCRNFFLILAHPVYKMWIIQEQNTLELWNKLHFEEKKNWQYIPCFKIFSTYICWINI